MDPLFPADIMDSARQLVEGYRSAGLKLATAESCTGGLIAACLTEIPGSSAVVERGFVTYSNEAKQDMLNVDAAILAQHGAVSEPVARAMALGALARSRADVAISVTGIAGPDGGSVEKPVGLVFLCCVRRGCNPVVHRGLFEAQPRSGVRMAALRTALDMLRKAIFSAKL